MNGRTDARRSALARVGLVTLCALGLILVAILIGMASLGVAAVFTGAGKPTGWDQINDAFGVVNSVFSALALIVVGLTLWVQYRELKMQRSELREQRLTADESNRALHQSAEASFRELHMKLLEMAINDPSLAQVWPSYGDDVSTERTRQYLYANLILQHQAFAIRFANRDVEYVRGTVRFCFSSPVVREFWAQTMAQRDAMVATDPQVIAFQRLCDEVYAEAGRDLP
jgi:hypothetical protein